MEDGERTKNEKKTRLKGINDPILD